VCVLVGVDKQLARHIAHLFIRDPISLFSEKLEQNDEEDTDHFEVYVTMSSFFLWRSRERLVQCKGENLSQYKSTHFHRSVFSAGNEASVFKRC